MRLRIAVVGAGLSGLTAAQQLTRRGHEVIVVDKARGPGGRMSTRRQGNLHFDHGAQYFTVRSAGFADQVARWREAGLVGLWEGRVGVVERDRIRLETSGTKRFIALPGMSALCHSLAADLPDCRFNWTVNTARYNDPGWSLESEKGEMLKADALLVTTPPRQALGILPDSFRVRQLAELDMRPCWAVMAHLDGPVFPSYDAAFVNFGPLSWLASQASKPGRPGGQAWVFHAGPEWSEHHLDADASRVCHELMAAAVRLPEARAPRVLEIRAHRWRYALARGPLVSGPIWFASHRLAVAGDWCNGSRVEGAYLSGIAAASYLCGGVD